MTKKHHPLFSVPPWLAMLAAAGMIGCAREEAPSAGPQYADAPQVQAKPHYRLAVHPLHNPKKLVESYQPLIELLNRSIPDATFELEASRDYQAFESKFRARQPEFLLPNPWQSLEAMKVGYHIIAMAGNADDFRGLLIVRRDADIRKPSDLKGRVVSYPSHTALAACMMPQLFLKEHGLDVGRDIENAYVGSQESSIMNVYLGKSAAGGTWPPPWRAFVKEHPAEAAELMVAWETPSLLNNSVMYRDDVPLALRQRVLATLVHIHESSFGETILQGMETGRFHAAGDDDYGAVKQFIEKFERSVRPVESR